MNKNPRKFLLSKTDLPEELINNLSDKEAWDILYSLPKPVQKEERIVVITGFRKAEKEAYVELAISSGYKVSGSVSLKTTIVCYGENAGPTKIAQAKELKIPLLNEHQFRIFLESGELP